MRWILFVCLWFSHTKITELMSMKFCIDMACIPGSDIGLLPFIYLFHFKMGALLVMLLHVKWVHCIVKRSMLNKFV